MPAEIEMLDPGTEPVRAVPADRDPEWDDDETIDHVLRLVADHHRALGALIGRRSFSPTIAELRQSPLGRDLRLLANAATDGVPAVAVRRAADRVADVLLRPLAADETTVPVWFWATAVGRLVARAEVASRGEAAFLSLAQAATRLEVGPETLRGWVAGGGLPALPDGAGGWLVARREVERRQAVRLALAGDRRPDDDLLLGEQRLAS